MSAGREDRFDVVLAAAWQRFETNLAAYITAMPAGTYITITSAQATHGQRGQLPYVDLVAVDAEQILGVAALPSYLYPNSPDIESADRRLHGLGWSEPGRPTVDGTVMDFVIDGVPDEADLLATVAVATFREVWNVPHPSFLSAWSVGLAPEHNGPVALAYEPAPARDSSVTDLPDALRSLHTWCELVGARVDAATVHAACPDEDLTALAHRARTYADHCAALSAQCARDGARAASRVWRQQARSWNDTAASLRSAASLRAGETPTRDVASGQDRPAKSTGS